MSKQRLLFAASEVFPFAKSGGLADVIHSLPISLSHEYDVRVVMPLYQSVDRQKHKIVSLDKSCTIVMGGVDYRVELYGCTHSDVNYYFIYSPVLCDRTFLYGTPEQGYEDNAIRFGIFSYAVIELLKYEKYSVVHLNDWQSALVALLLKEDETIKTKSLFTIHNLAYQGIFEKPALKDIGLLDKYFNMQSLEFHGNINLMKAGIAYADIVTTVSPTYAKEILTPEFGYGLEGFLRYHSNKLVGIVNGIDTDHFSPSSDKALFHPYANLSGKVLNKRDYLKQIGLKDVKKPLFIFIGRFSWQKGVDLLIETLPKIASFECNIAILGDGEAKYRNKLKEITDEHKNIYLETGYDESLSHRMYAAADFLLMPSIFEPCGLTQIISMHYGAMPIVNHVGGLVDTVNHDKDFDSNLNHGYGVLFTNPTISSFVEAVEYAMEIYADKQQYKKIVKHNMKCDFSWNESSKIYIELYNRLSK